MPAYPGARLSWRKGHKTVCCVVFCYALAWWTVATTKLFWDTKNIAEVNVVCPRILLFTALILLIRLEKTLSPSLQSPKGTGINSAVNDCDTVMETQKQTWLKLFSVPRIQTETLPLTGRSGVCSSVIMTINVKNLTNKLINTTKLQYFLLIKSQEAQLQRYKQTNLTISKLCSGYRIGLSNP